MIVFWSEEAYNELDAVVDYTASYNPGMAERVVDQI
jgi:plasmid stabilization system protein ParE